MVIKDGLKKYLVTINVVSSGTQVLLIGAVYFFLYKFLLKLLGVSLLGVWSVVLSTSSLANLANFGVADSVIRFVALYHKEKNDLKIKQLIFTASIFIGILFLLISCIIYPFAGLILKSVLPSNFINAGISILPYSLACLLLNAINGVYASVLDGMQKNYLRSLVFSASSIVLLVVSYLLVPKYGIIGVAMAQLAQSIFALVVCILIVMYQTKFNPLIWNWSKEIFRQIFNYGMKFQFISLMAMLNEPVTKILLGRFGGMAFAGYYEMANRVLMQARGVVINGTQSLIPVMINLSNNIKDIQHFYKKVFSNVLFFSLAAMGLIVMGGRILSVFWIGNYQPVFYYTLLILALCILINILNTPAYFFYMAEAKLNILLKTQFILGLSNSLFGYTLGYLIGGYGVIYGWFLSVLFGSLYILWLFNKMYQLKITALFRTPDVCFIFIVFLLIVVNNFSTSINLKGGDFIGLALMLIVIVFYFFKYKLTSLRPTLTK
ncbi:Membrane protein involved in the export of O-antigen and teichoic acid [Mucilaginibacter pineti]|uniref:Membrane protein involved in the export of O-antigen and teichoic acid n=1 Tax=Mucilaginibacter pineti TaxID=1391627 RepID=A0A1G6YZP4_9SPHI|nr:oligosaccharide flippase family protein [Mucilaginibacter pineti]SDD95859.1 Membrane protein involved in the export of O-antigen and teichoic acid [Mucilaginibacter pineti]